MTKRHLICPSGIACDFPVFSAGPTGISTRKTRAWVGYFADNQIYDQGPMRALQITDLDGSTYQVAFRVGVPSPPFTIYVKDNSWEIAGPYPKGGALQMNMFWIEKIRGGRPDAVHPADQELHRHQEDREQVLQDVREV
jgi:hypothetical protein